MTPLQRIVEFEERFREDLAKQWRNEFTNEDWALFFGGEGAVG